MTHYVNATYVAKKIRVKFDSELVIPSNCTTVQLSREEALDLLGQLTQAIQRAYQK